MTIRGFVAQWVGARWVSRPEANVSLYRFLIKEGLWAKVGEFPFFPCASFAS